MNVRQRQHFPHHQPGSLQLHANYPSEPKQIVQVVCDTCDPRRVSIFKLREYVQDILGLKYTEEEEEELVPGTSSSSSSPPPPPPPPPPSSSYPDATKFKHNANPNHPLRQSHNQITEIRGDKKLEHTKQKDAGTVIEKFIVIQQDGFLWAPRGIWNHNNGNRVYSPVLLDKSSVDLAFKFNTPIALNTVIDIPVMQNDDIDLEVCGDNKKDIKPNSNFRTKYTRDYSRYNCRICSKTGHVARNCTEKAKIYCQLCSNYGHLKQNCPKKCTKCNLDDRMEMHIMTECPTNKSKNVKKGRRCYVCEENPANHLPKVCPEVCKERGCYRKGSYHNKNKCPNYPKNLGFG